MSRRRGERSGVVRIIARTNVGGPSLQVTALMRGLDGEHTLLRGTVADGEADYLDLRAPDIHATTVPGLGRSVRVLGDLRAFLFIVRELRRRRPLVVHTHTAKAGVLGRLAAVLTRVPIRVHTFHGHVLTGYFRPGVAKLVASVECALNRFTTHTVVVGDQVRAELIEAGVIDPATSSVVAPGVRSPFAPSRQDARRHFGLAPDAQVVVFVGRFTHIKRVERVLELARALRDDIPQPMVALVGDGPELATLREAAHDLPNVRFLGWQADMPAVYAAADVAVLTSDNEGMPVTLIEAAMQGVPAVSTAVGSAGQVVVDGETGYLVAPGDAHALAAAVSKLLTNEPLRREMGLAAATRARDLFSEERLVADHAALYARLAHIA